MFKILVTNTSLQHVSDLGKLRFTKLIVLHQLSKEVTVSATGSTSEPFKPSL
jgi:hypothetical protein